MLEKIDLSKKVEKTEFKKLISELELKVAVLQRKAKDFGIPIVIVFEGWDAAGKGTLINRLIKDVKDRNQLETLVLFTGENNTAARRLYESLHFKHNGYFGLLFGSWTETDMEA